MEIGLSGGGIQERSEGEGEGEGESENDSEKDRESGYLCFGNWQKLCASGNEKSSAEVRKRTRKSSHADKRVVVSVYDSTTTILSTLSSYTMQSTESPTATTSMLPTLGTNFPLPMPSQTDCDFDYIW